MKLSYKDDYTMKVLLHLSLHYGKDLLHIEDIAKAQDIPRKFLEQILLELKKAGFVESKKGPNGGYTLAKKPKDITLAAVVTFLQGSLYPISCVDKKLPQSCTEGARCVFAPIWKKLGDITIDYLNGITFEDLKEQYKNKKEEALSYVI